MPGPSLVELDAVVGFVDLAGFTAAAEGLGAFGPQGTEQLSDLINALFTPAIEFVHAAGGEIGWFAGDAVGVIFDRATTPPQEAVRALTDAAAGIAANPPFTTVAGPLTLGVKVGVAAGLVRWVTVGDDHRVTWFSGPAVDAASEAEHHAVPGDLILHPTVLPLLDPGAEASPLRWSPHTDEGHARVEPTAHPPSVSAAPVRASHVLSARRAPELLPSRVARLARSGDVEFLDEHRPVTIVFQQFPFRTHDPEQLESTRRTLREFGGLLSSVSEGDKGATILAMFGAPTALADRQSRAIQAACRLLEAAPGSSFGITSGRVFTGRVGSATRWDYSVVGDRANTAARFMQAAEPGEILVDEFTAAGAGTSVVVADPRQLVLKGKIDPQAAFPVVGVRSSRARGARTRRSGPFVGRRSEVDELRSRLAVPGTTIAFGPAGLGKSRLLEHVVALLGIDPVQVAVEQTDRGRPFVLWSRLLTGITGVAADELLDQLPGHLAGDDRLPLLGPLLGRAVPDTRLTSSLGPDDRLEVVTGLVRDLIAAMGEPRPIVIEDLHWADEGSVQLLAAMAGSLAGLGYAVVATSRPDLDHGVLGDAAAVQTLTLAPIATADLVDLAQAFWLQEFGIEASSSIAEEIAARSGGSPLFCQQLVTFARTQGVRSTALALPAEIGVPVTLADLLLARLDALPEDAIMAATYASVLSGVVRLDDLVGAFGGRHGDGRIVSGIEALVDQGILVGLEDYRFSHSLFKESTYERLSYGLRSRLHLSALRYLEDRYADDLDAHAADLARHSERTDDDDRKRRWFRAAADQAAAVYANDVSRYWYRALAPLLDGEARGAVQLTLGTIEAVAGNPADAEVLLTSALGALPAEEQLSAELELARVLVQLGRAGEAFDRLDVVLDRLRAEETWEGLHRAMEVTADLATMLGDIERAERIEALHHELVATFGPDHPASGEIILLVPLLWLRGELDAAVPEYERVYRHFLDVGDLLHAGYAANDLAGLHFERGEVIETLRWLEIGKQLIGRVGHREFLVGMCGNEADLRIRLGDVEGSRTVVEGALRVALEEGGGRVLAGLLLRAGSLVPDAVAGPLIEMSLVLFERAEDAVMVPYAISSLADVYARTGDRTIARSLLAGLENAHPNDPQWAIRRMLLDVDSDEGGAEFLRDRLNDCEGSIDPELRARGLAMTALCGADTELIAVALEACRQAHRGMPSTHLEDLIDRLGGERPPSLRLPTPTPIGEPLPVLEFLDHTGSVPRLIGWEQAARAILHDTVDQRRGN